MTVHTIYLGLGANLGDRVKNLKRAADSLPPEVRVIEQSPVYETPPWGYTDQPSFLNQVIEGRTALAPADLLAYVKQLEVDLGREQTFRYGPRLIDIDILFYDRITRASPELTVPHPRLHERAFVLVPLADLAPNLRHPKLGKTIRDLLDNVDASGVKRFERVQ